MLAPERTPRRILPDVTIKITALLRGPAHKKLYLLATRELSQQFIDKIDRPEAAI